LPKFLIEVEVLGFQAQILLSYLRYHIMF